jgi:hypothetical protein
VEAAQRDAADGRALLVGVQAVLAKQWGVVSRLVAAADKEKEEGKAQAQAPAAATAAAAAQASATPAPGKHKKTLAFRREKTAAGPPLAPPPPPPTPPPPTHDLADSKEAGEESEVVYRLG